MWPHAHDVHACCAAEPEYAAKLIKHAKQMLEFGLAHPGSYMTSKLEGLKDHSKHYPSSNYNDEMAWGALWLHLATQVSLSLCGTPSQFTRCLRRLQPCASHALVASLRRRGCSAGSCNPALYSAMSPL